jgi:hypothetical protein
VHASQFSPRRKTTSAATLVATVGLLLTACGDDEPTTADAASLDEFCSVAAQLNSQDSLPTPEQLAEYQSLAPEEIAEPTATVVEAFESAADDPQAVFTDDAALAAIEELTAFEAEACGLEPPETASNNEIDSDATRVDITASEYTFDTDDPTAAGRYSFVMTNAGAEPHLVVVAQLESGVALEDVLASDGDVGVIRAAESAVAPPGGESVVTVDLEPGRWIIVCPIPNEDGESHAALGMLRELTIS